MTRRGRFAVALTMLATGCAPAPENEPRVAAIAPVPPGGPAFELTGAFSQGGVVLGRAPEGSVSVAIDGQTVPLADDGRFLIAFDRDALPGARLVARARDGQVIERALTIAPRAWRIENLSTLPRQSRPSADFTRLRPAELAEIGRARAIESGAEGWRQRFRWPVTGRVSGLFGAQRVYRGAPGAYHGGVDVARATGTPFVAPADGVVVLATTRPFTLEGNLLIVDHGMGLNSAFLHLSRIDVRAGDRVRQGQVLGLIGATGRATGPHLHWGMKWRDRRIDPLLLAGPMVVGG